MNKLNEKSLDRRQLIKNAALLSLAPTVPGFLRSAAAAQNESKRILVVVQLSGGNDGLNTVIPFRDENYSANRKRLQLPQDRILKLTDETALHPAMGAMSDLLEDGRLAIVRGVGYPKPNRSHDVSMAVWHTASTDQEDHDGHGWLGRVLDRERSSQSEPQSLLVADTEIPLALRGRKSRAIAMDSLTEFEVPTNSPVLSENATASPLAEFMQRATLDAYETADRMQDLLAAAENDSGSNLSRQRSSLARRLGVIAKLIAADFGPRVYYCMQPGYDTHSDQLQTHNDLLGTLSRSLKAFLDDVESLGRGRNVTVLCFSEFGRQVRENGSAGTDHGTAGPVFLAGSAIQPGIFGAHPDLSKLEQNAPQHTVDFRSVYASVLEDWLKVPAAELLGKPASDHKKLPLFI